jgi:hypothetical protein
MTEIVGTATPGLVDITGRAIPKVGAAPEVPFEERAKQLPTPSGYRILCAIPEIEKETAGGIHGPLRREAGS